MDKLISLVAGSNMVIPFVLFGGHVDADDERILRRNAQ
jgi:hypothetical protein